MNQCIMLLKLGTIKLIVYLFKCSWLKIESIKKVNKYVISLTEGDRERGAQTSSNADEPTWQKLKYMCNRSQSPKHNDEILKIT